MVNRNADCFPQSLLVRWSGPRFIHPWFFRNEELELENSVRCRRCKHFWIGTREDVKYDFCFRESIQKGNASDYRNPTKMMEPGGMNWSATMERSRQFGPQVIDFIFRCQHCRVISPSISGFQCTIFLFELHPTTKVGSLLFPM
jgi:hypothetical protein